MAIRPLTTVRHAITALVLLGVALVGVEVWMRTREAAVVQIVASQVNASDQSLLVPSAVCHHELRRLLKTTHRVREGSAGITFRVNSLGCRGEDVNADQPDGTYRILMLGDDSICGTSVAEEETVAARLKQFLSKSTTATIEVINGGVPGYCPLLSSLKFEHDLAKLKPDLVILHVDMTDIADDCSYRSLVLQDGLHSVCSHATLRLPSTAENPVLHVVKESATASWVFTKARQHGPALMSLSNALGTVDPGLNWITDHPSDLRLQIRHCLEPIKNLQDSVARSGGRLLVTTSPVLWQVVSAEEAPELSRRYGITGATPFVSQFPFEVIGSFCRSSQIHFCDASPAFRNSDAARLFAKDAPVLSRVGMALYAREIARCLLEDPPSRWSD